MQPRLPTKLVKLVPRLPIAALTESLEFVSMWRWARLSLVVGLLVGLAAAGIELALDLAGEHLIEGLAHYYGPDGTGDLSRWWLLVLLPAAGGLAAGILIHRFASETRGAGTNEVIHAFHHDNGVMRRRVPLVKALATIFTLGTGGSGGREGPVSQIGAGIGSTIAGILDLSARERRLLLLAGASAGISALFRTPLGASLWALEIIYREDFESDGLFPCLVSSVTAYSVATLLFGQGSLFRVPVEGFPFHPTQLFFYAMLAVACAPAAVLWLKISAYFDHRFWPAVPAPPWLKPALGGLLMGAMCLAVPWVYGSGYGWMQDALKAPGDPTRQLPIGTTGFALLLALAVGKMIATSLTTGSGGSAGKFAPTLFIGGFVGEAFGLLFHEWAPTIVTHPGAFMLVGMGAFYASIAKAPIATIILVSELFGSYDLLVPLMLSEMITLVLLRRFALYPAQVAHAYDSPAHEADFTVDVLRELCVADHYTKGRAAEPVSAAMPLPEFLAHVSRAADSFFVVHGKGGDLVGIVSLSNIRAVMGETDFLEFAVVGDAMWPLRSVAPDLDLRAALEQFLSSGYDHLPVIDPADPRVVLGMLSQQQIFAAYNAEILRRRLAGREDETTMAG